MHGDQTKKMYVILHEYEIQWNPVMILSLCKLYHGNYNLIQVNN